MASASEKQRNLGITLIIGGIVAAILCAVGFWGASQEDWNIWAILGAIGCALLAVVLIVIGAKNVIAAGRFE